jgi:ribosomal protein L19
MNLNVTDMEKIKVEPKYNIGDKIIVTINVLHNNTGREFEGTVLKIEHNPFRGIVLTVDAKENGTFFDIADNFKKA